MARKCERCNAEMAPGRPRVRVSRQLWCQTCAKDSSAPSGRYRPGSDIAATAMSSDPAHPDNHLFTPVNRDFPACTTCGFDEHWHPHLHQGSNAVHCSVPGCDRDMSHYLHDKGKVEHLTVRDNPVPDDPSSMWQIRSSLTSTAANTEPIQSMIDHWDKVNLGLGRNSPENRERHLTHLKSLRDQGHTHAQWTDWESGRGHFEPVHPSTGVVHIEDAIKNYADRAGKGAGDETGIYSPEGLAQIYHPRVKALIDLQNQGFTHARWGRDYEGDEVNKWHGAFPNAGPTHLSSRAHTDPMDFSQCVSRKDNPSFCLHHQSDHLNHEGEPEPFLDGLGNRLDTSFEPPQCDLCNGYHSTMEHYSPDRAERESEHHRVQREHDSLRGFPVDGARRTPNGYDAISTLSTLASFHPVVLGITSSLRRTTASDDDFAKHFNDQMAGSEGKALGEHLWDGMAKAFGFEDGEHMHAARQNRDHETLAERYKGQPGKLGMDENGEPHYEIHHPSGWIGRMNVGPYMDISHKATPTETHEILDVGQSDSNGHVLHPSMATDDPLVNHHRAHWALHNFVKEHGEEYADNIPKIKSWMGRRGLTSQGSRWGDEDDEDRCPSCGVPGDPDDEGQHYSNCKKGAPTLEDREDALYDRLHPADYCGDGCRSGHASDLVRGIGSHHIFAPGEAEHDDKRNLPSSVAPHSQSPHEEPGYRHGNGVYEYRDPGKDARCHYCRSPLLDLSKETPTMPNPRQGLRTVAHDSGDGETIYHCPFCGSGQVIARSDGTIDCEFCHTMFTVQVQPEYPAFPQTINGMPVQVPGMPGQIDNPVGATPPGDPNAPMDPSQVGADPADPSGDGAVDADGDGQDDDFEAPASASNQPPWLKGSSLVTAAGKRLDPEDFVAHLAIKHAPDKTAVIEQVRARRKS